jgi:RNA polymerase sigma-70 factor (family 1)
MENESLKYVSRPLTADEPNGNKIQEANVLDDRLMWKALIDGDQEAFEQVYKFYGKRIHFICRNKFFMSNEDAEEVIQDTFIRIWQNRGKLDATKSVNAYILAVAKSIILNNIRKHASALAYRNYLILKPDCESDTENQVVLHDLEDNLKKVLDDLPPQRKTIFILSKFHDMSNDEIAAKLNICKRTVENQLYRAMKTVKEHMRSFKIILFLASLSDFL